MTGWTRIHLTTTTPVFNSDGRPEKAEIRVPSIRGLMRFWLRAMAGVFAAGRLTELRAIEDEILGSTGVSSPVKLRIPNQPEGEFDPDPLFLIPDDRSDRRDPNTVQEHRNWLCYLLGPGLASWDSKEGRPYLDRAHIPPGEEFELWLRFTGGADKKHAHICAVTALWLGLTYGGIGARTRRGFGGVRITDVDGDLPGPWDADSFATPGLDWYRRITTIWLNGVPVEAKNALQRVAASKGIERPERFDGHPTYPVLSTEHTKAGTSSGTYGSWSDTMVRAGAELRSFRAPNPHQTQKYRPPLKTHEWLDTIHGESTDFEIGALGLPVVFGKGIEVHADQGKGNDAPKLRRASPLCFRPVGNGKHWALFSFGFLTEFLPDPDAPSVHLWRDKKQDKELTVTSTDAHDLVGKWVKKVSTPDETFTENLPGFRTNGLRGQ